MTSRATRTSASFLDWVREIARGCVIAVALALGIAAGLFYYVVLGDLERRHLLEYLKAAAWTSFELGSVVELGLRGEEIHRPPQRVSETRRRYEELRIHVFQGRSVTDLSWELGVIAAIFIVFSTIPVCWVVTRKFKTAGEGRWVRGAQLISRRRLNRRRRPLYHRVLYAFGSTIGCPGLRLAGVTLPYAEEVQHLFVVGDTGTGKTSLIRAALHQLAQRDDRVIVFDRGGTLAEEFFIERRGDLILNALDARCPEWDLARDVAGPGGPGAMATRAIQQPREIQSGSDRFWETAGRVVLAEALRRAYPLDPAGVARTLITFGPRELADFVRGSVAAMLIDPKAANQTAGVRAMLASVAQALSLVPESAARSWSARAWVEREPGWLFLTTAPTRDDAADLLTALWLDTLIATLLGRNNARRTFVVLDELASLQPLRAVENLITLGRQCNVAAILGVQNIAQVERLYGRQVRHTMLSQVKTRFVLRCSDPDTAEEMSREIGEREREIEQPTVSRGSSHSGTTRGYTDIRDTGPLILAAQVQRLLDRHGFVIHPCGVAKIVVPLIRPQARAPRFIPREDLWGPELPTDEEPPTAPGSDGIVLV